MSESITLECGPVEGQVWVVSTRTSEQWPDAWRDGVSVWSPSQDFQSVPVPLGLGRTLVGLADGRDVVVARWNGDNEVSLPLEGCWADPPAPPPSSSSTVPPVVVVSAPPPVPQTVPPGDALTSITMVEVAQPALPVLPVTGGSVAPLVIVAVLLILAGVALLAGRR